MKPFRTAAYDRWFFRGQVEDGEVGIYLVDGSICSPVMWLNPEDAKRFRKWLKKAGF